MLDEKCYLWPCNLATFNLWQSVNTQWHVSDGRRTGLDYASVLSYMREIAAIKGKDRSAIFSGLQAMETASLVVWSQERE